MLVDIYHFEVKYLNVHIKYIGYSGADLKGVCSHASILAFHRNNPNIYSGSRKLKYKGNIMVTAKDFENVSSLFFLNTLYSQ